MLLLKRLLFFFVIFIFLSLIVISFMKVSDIVKEILTSILCSCGSGLRIFSIVSSYSRNKKRKASDVVLYIANIIAIIGIISMVTAVILFHIEIDFIIASIIFGLGIFLPIPKKGPLYETK